MKSLSSVYPSWQGIGDCIELPSATLNGLGKRFKSKLKLATVVPQKITIRLQKITVKIQSDVFYKEGPQLVAVVEKKLHYQLFNSLYVLISYHYFISSKSCFFVLAVLSYKMFLLV